MSYPKLNKLALCLGIALLSAQAFAATTAPCPVQAAVTEGQAAAAQAALAQVATVRAAVQGTPNDGYATAAQARATSQKCMFDASDVMGNVARGGDLSGVVASLTKLLSSPDSGCITNMTAIADAAKQQAAQYAKSQAQQAISQEQSQLNSKLSQAVSNAGPVAQGVAAGLGSNGLTPQQLSQKQINDAWASLSKQLSTK